LEHLLKKAKEEEKKYEWLQAAKDYEKASEWLLEAKDLLEAAELQERVGFCFYRAAMQSKDNTEFKSVLKQSILAYEKEAKLLESANREEYQAKIDHANAMIAYVKSWYEPDPDKVKALLDEWWTLENQVLNAYESLGDTHSVGVVCADLIEFSQYTRLWLSTHSEEVKLEKEVQSLAEKAIKALSKSDDNYELARAYCFASAWFCSQSHGEPELGGRRAQIVKKGYEYSKKALALASEIEDAWLIGYAHYSACVAAMWYDQNCASAVDYGEEAQKYASIAKDNLLLSSATWYAAYANNSFTVFLEDPDKQRTIFEKARELAQECALLSNIINWMTGACWGCNHEIWARYMLAALETDPENKQNMLQNAIKIAREGLEILRGWKRLPGILYNLLGASLSLLSKTKSKVEDRKTLLLEAQSYQKENIAQNEEYVPFLYLVHAQGYFNLGLVQIELANIETDKTEKVEFLEKAVVSLEKSGELFAKDAELHPETAFIAQIWGLHCHSLGRVLQQTYYLTKEEKTRSRAIEAHKNAAAAYTRGELPAHAAESYWYIAHLEGQVGEHQKASQNYESASQAYDLASIKMPQLKEFYKDYSLYMQAWSQLEQARLNHSVEEYGKARQNYQKAAMLHESTASWSYLATNYSAWASIEEAESLSRKENTQQAKVTFQKALEQFKKAEASTRERIEKIASEEEKEMTQKLLQASNLRRKYCQARILVEDAKLLDREGKYLQSSRSYGEAAVNISEIIGKTDVESERKELKYLAILCQAWEKMAKADEANSSESYLEAAELFEKAKDYCYTRKASLWALGNSNFCKGLAAGVRYQTDLELKEHNRAKGYIKNAATNYLKAGYKNASEYAKGIQRLFDAYLFMNQAESETDTEKRVKQYRLTENLLQIAAGSFLKAKQPDKTTQVQQILENVREEKELAISFNEVLQAPTIASSTSSFAAPTSTGEKAVGLERFEHANVQANLITHVNQVKIGESFCLSIEFVNAGREPALLMRVEDFVHPNFIVVKKPEIYRIEDSTLNMKGKQLAPLKLVEAKLVLQPSKKGVYQLKPKVNYLDERGQSRFLELKSLEIHVEEIVLSDRIATGTKELDSLLLGGIPKEYAVALAGPPSDERESVINNFLEAGIKEGEITFYISAELTGLGDQLENPNFFLFLCNPRPKAQVPDLPNVYKLQGATDLTNLGIALAKACRGIGKSVAKRRVCVEILSDVLVEYGTKTAREWMSGLITDLGSKGFTLLAVINPTMHPPDQANAVLDLFDGEISILQSDDPLDCKKSILVKKLRNQDYIRNPICLT
jgi:hypothetical protein